MLGSDICSALSPESTRSVQLRSSEEEETQWVTTKIYSSATRR